MASTINKLIANRDCKGLREILSRSPELANEGIPFDEKNTTKAHPLHRICDWVFSKTLTGEEAVRMACIFLEHGAAVNGVDIGEYQDTPLLAASSLHADQLAFLYIDRGADIHHAGCHGGTALHWAAWCGRDAVVKRLIAESAEINRLCSDFQATPLFWAVHGLKCGGRKNRHNQETCARLLIQAGADHAIPNGEGTYILDMLNEDDRELKAMIES